ncbi:MAG: IS200/IS605 family transposase [Rickettsia endosymbiont of Ixodes persulcatus]|nr:IS200/IS605 family transposase [Rickettsia endosymbiont of Ixodes persulcatus]
MHFLIQSVPSYSPTKVARIVKSITAKKMFEKFPDLKNKLWGTEFWTNGYFMSRVGKHRDEKNLISYLSSSFISLFTF